jgi:hypothetical protein
MTCAEHTPTRIHFPQWKLGKLTRVNKTCKADQAIADLQRKTALHFWLATKDQQARANI